MTSTICGLSLSARSAQLGHCTGRLGKTQFEIFSADFIVDTHGGGLPNGMGNRNKDVLIVKGQLVKFP